MVRSRKIDGGFTRMPNRWIDAGYMAAAPGSVTQVYLFLCRWADNQTGVAEQSIAQTARKLRSNEDRVRKATKVLQAWQVIERLPSARHNSIPRWRLLSLPRRAPDYPSQEQIASLRDPIRSEGSAGKAGRASSLEHHGSPLGTIPSATVPFEVVPTGEGRTYNTTHYHTTSNQTTATIPSSGAEAPTDGASDAGAQRVSPRAKHAIDEEDVGAWHATPNSPAATVVSARKEERARRRELVRRLREVLNGYGYEHVLTNDQARDIYAGRDVDRVLDDDQLDLWTTESIPAGEWEDDYPF